MRSYRTDLLVKTAEIAALPWSYFVEAFIPVDPQNQLNTYYEKMRLKCFRQ